MDDPDRDAAHAMRDVPKAAATAESPHASCVVAAKDASWLPDKATGRGFRPATDGATRARVASLSCPCRWRGRSQSRLLQRLEGAHGESMIVRKLRLQRGWSQAQLAEMVGVATRTIQRIEQGQRPSLETARALASVFGVDFSTFQPDEPAMPTESERPADYADAGPRDAVRPASHADADTQEALRQARMAKEFLDSVPELRRDEQEAMVYAKRVKEFYEFLATWLVIAPVFLIAFHDSHRASIVYIILGALGLGVVIQGLLAFEVVNLPFFGPGWERRLVERRLRRRL
ncbi:helix-turn-helix domain-containing protein [Lysobacter sp. N42]|uniref:helix-turn-helix domain-containing protein n=1 Tax=Lysobacter sp. N42 TaxID=2545719 RepID=UPI0010F10982|nr:helix-turn-helix domain-containing protein [Lysobacter sp. N42]TCZ89089.1 helix-turn-helix domain-containing protein [Lysobacter sp. N42]